ncbi:MAG TPA: glycosyl hydrolase family 8 [Polyangia bacterium]|jgi:endo-1,4-beta-D-glucanase Y|nr:glycosyl hydrolase family 8 [Polyangia bacterium]
MHRSLFRLLSLTLVPAAMWSCSSGGGGGGGGSGGSGSAGASATGSGGTSGGSGGASGSGGTSGGSGGATMGSGGSNVDGGGQPDTGKTDGGGTGGGTDGGGTGGTMAANTGQMFGSHKFQYPAGTIKPSAANLDAAVAAFYDKWKAAYVVSDCGGAYIATGGGTGAIANTVDVSEGQGYGMAIVPMMAGHDPNAQKTFDALYAVYHMFGSINDPNLMSWSIQEGCMVPHGNGDINDSATDGDMDIAYGLVLADRQWGSAGAINYLAEAKKIIGSIKAHEVNPTTNIMMMGDWSDIKAPYYTVRYMSMDGPYGGDQPFANFYYGTRPSDFMIDHFRAYARASGDQSWMAVVDATHTLVKKLEDGFASSTGLLPDFVEHLDTNPTPAMANYLESEADGRVGYNSCRVPWHLATDYIVSGDVRAKTEAQKITTWIKGKTGSDPTKIVDGYELNGANAGTGKVFAFEAPFGVAAIVDASNQAWLDAIWKDMVTNSTGTVSYYDDSIKMLSILIMSGNWFAP